MSCPAYEDLLSFAAGELEAADAARISDHLATSCARCATDLAHVRSLRDVAGSDALQDPPEWVLRRAASIPSEPPASRVAQLAGRLAALVYDTLRDPLPAGARAVAAHSRQMLFRALDYDIDVRVASAAGGSVRISGQVLPGPERPIDDVAGIDVVLLADGSAAGQHVTNELGEFEFDGVAPGDYSLAIEAAEDRIVVDTLTAQPS